MKTSIIILSIVVSALAWTDHDYIKTPTICKVVYTDDYFAIRDTVITAVSVHKDGNQWRVLPDRGPTLICSQVVFIMEAK
jgi:hypothetical protein